MNHKSDIFLKNWDSLHARPKSHYQAWSYKKKKHIHVKEYRKSVLKEPTIKRYLLILDVKLLTVDIGIYVSSRNGDREIMQAIRIKPSNLHTSKAKSLILPH